MDSERSPRALSMVSGNDDNGDDEHQAKASLHRRPIECQWCQEDSAAPGGGRFRVLRARGKTLGAGGYGYYLPSTSLRTDTLASVHNTATCADAQETPSPPNDMIHAKNDTARISSTTPTAAVSAAAGSMVPNPPEHYLFLEEVIYLHERGLLTVLNVSLNELYTRMFHNNNNVSVESRSMYCSSSNVTMAAYLVYAHLRSQTFRVVRHTATRGRILQGMMDRLEYLNSVSSSLTKGDDIVAMVDDTNHQTYSSLDMEPASDDDGDSERETLGGERNDQDHTVNNVDDNAEATAVSKRSSKRPWWRRDAQLHAYKQALRRDAAEAPPPRLLGTGYPTLVPQPAFDCYHPQPNFASACPGPPDFRVVITHFHTLAPQPSCENPELNGSGEPGPEPNNDKDAALKPSEGLLFSDLMQLLQSSAIPLKVATVSDSGTVVMFGVTDFGAPGLTALANESATVEQS
jgi:hypothetical protein